MTDDETEMSPKRERDSIGSRIAEDLSAYTALTTDFYRGEIDRMSTWRSRLDQTTNWAVVLVAAILTWAFSSAQNPHYVILIGIFGTVAFLVMEATRYREYDIWRDRVRTLQVDLFADVYASESTSDTISSTDWQTRLSEELRDPTFEISFLQALSHRLRRSYLALLLILLLAWLTRITVFEPSEPWRQTASIFVIPGDVVVGIVAAFYAIAIGITIWSAREGRVQEFQE